MVIFRSYQQDGAKTCLLFKQGVPGSLSISFLRGRASIAFQPKIYLASRTEQREGSSLLSEDQDHICVVFFYCSKCETIRSEKKRKEIKLLLGYQTYSSSSDVEPDAKKKNERKKAKKKGGKENQGWDIYGPGLKDNGQHYTLLTTGLCGISFIFLPHFV